MTALKTIILLTLLILTSHSFGQNNLYMITEKIRVNPIGPDSVFVTSPNGITTTYVLENYSINPASHDAEMNQIINNIINSGYQLSDMGNWYSTTLVSSNTYLIRTIFLKEP